MSNKIQIDLVIKTTKSVPSNRITDLFTWGYFGVWQPKTTKIVEETEVFTCFVDDDNEDSIKDIARRVVVLYHEKNTKTLMVFHKNTCILHYEQPG